jgi:hypothetical protein
MTNSFANTLDSLTGIQAEDHILEYLAKRFTRENRKWALVHSVCSDEIINRVKLPNVVTWIESTKKNSQLGDIRIYRADQFGRMMRGPVVYVDIKYSKKWDYSSVTFKKTGENPKADSIRHLCGFVGKGIDPSDFWYLTMGKRGTYILTLEDVQTFVKSASEEEMIEICQEGKFNDTETWFMSFERIIDTCASFDLDTWIEEILVSRLG